MTRNLQDEHSKQGLLQEAIFESAIDGIITINERGSIERLNNAAAVLFGYQKSEIEGQNISMLMPSPHRESHDSYLGNYHRTGTARIIGIGRQVEGLRKDGSTFPFWLAVSEVRFHGKRFYAGIIHDISDIKAAQDEIEILNRNLEKRVQERTEKLNQVVNKLIESNKQLEREITERQAAEKALRASQTELEEALEKEKELNMLKSRFVSMASHEFRTPLSTILSSTELLEAYTTSEQQPKRDKHIRRVKSAVNSLNGILNDFLSLSKLEEGRISLQPEHVQPGELIEGAADEMRGLLRDGQHLQVDTSGLSEKPVLLDGKLLKNILYNLISNAIKYTPAGKDIFVRCRVADGELQVEVEDHGIGIPEEDQSHLFSRFFRAHNAENIQGTGLGLNIVRRYLTLMDGDISFQSTEGVGSTFRFFVPLQPFP